MITIAYYFLKVMLISTLLMVYYRLFLYNKKFHTYNRFYILFTVVFSWIIPLISIPIVKNEPTLKQPIVYEWVDVVANKNTHIDNLIKSNNHTTINWDNIIYSIFILICTIMLMQILLAFYKIYQLIKTNTITNLHEALLIITNAKGTPFSFFKYIFWNEEITLTSAEGKQILAHELVHVKEKHSIDKLIMQLVLVIGWFNPVFWWANKELAMIHEFIADDKSIQHNKGATLAAMLLHNYFPQQKHLITNPFFLSSIKRRVNMLTQNKTPKLSYARRIIALPITALLIMLVSFKITNKEDNAITNLTKTYTVVIDAGHGGTDIGASENNLLEKDINLAIARLIKNNNNNRKLNIILLRSDDVFYSVEQRANFCNSIKADLFVSVHTDFSNNKQHKGFTIYVPDSSHKKYAHSKNLAAYLTLSLGIDYVTNGIKTREQAIWQLKASKCPAVLIECGFISNDNDAALLKNTVEQKKIANNILKGIEHYLVEEENSSLPFMIEDVQINKNVSPTGDKPGRKLEGSIQHKNFSLNFEADRLEDVNNNSQEMKIINASVQLNQKNREFKFEVDSIFMGESPNGIYSFEKATFIVNNRKISFEEAKQLLQQKKVSYLKYITNKDTCIKKYKATEDGVVELELKPGVKTAYPLEDGFISTHFGEQKMMNGLVMVSPNEQVDVSSYTNNKVISFDEGIVVFSGTIIDKVTIMIKQKDYIFIFNNLETSFVQKNQQIKKGDCIGLAKKVDNAYLVSVSLASRNRKFLDPTSLLVLK